MEREFKSRPQEKSENRKKGYFIKNEKRDTLLYELKALGRNTKIETLKEK